MSDLTEFLSARLDEDEAVAISAGDRDDIGGYSVEPFDEAPILTIGPGRVLAEVAAKRRIVEMCDGAEQAVLATIGRDDFMAEAIARAAHATAEAAARIIAAVYCYHSDFDPAWAV